MYTAPENFYRAADGTITTEPLEPSGERREMVAGCGAVMSKAEARERGLLPPEEKPADKPEAKSKSEPKGEPKSSPESTSKS